MRKLVSYINQPSQTKFMATPPVLNTYSVASIAPVSSIQKMQRVQNNAARIVLQ